MGTLNTFNLFGILKILQYISNNIRYILMHLQTSSKRFNEKPIRLPERVVGELNSQSWKNLRDWMLLFICFWLMESRNGYWLLTDSLFVSSKIMLLLNICMLAVAKEWSCHLDNCSARCSTETFDQHGFSRIVLFYWTCFNTKSFN